jgi:hypothetical protein
MERYGGTMFHLRITAAHRDRPPPLRTPLAKPKNRVRIGTYTHRNSRLLARSTRCTSIPKNERKVVVFIYSIRTVMSEQHKRHLELIHPSTDAMITEYHAMRKRMLFAPLGRPYDENYPGDSLSINHHRVLLLDGEVIGTVRIDIDVLEASFRLVTIREDLQDCGFGRRLIALSEDFVRSLGCSGITVRTGDHVVGFWGKCGYSRFPDGRHINMRKVLLSR